jgi:hypothetical protein
MMHGHEKSDSAIVAKKPPNKTGKPAAEAAERRAGTKGNTGRHSTRRTQIRESVSQALDRVRQAARQRKKEKFTALLHHISVETLEVAFYALKRKAAPGVDGVTWQEYDADLERRLIDLHGRIHRGAYRLQPSRRSFDLWAERWRRREATGDMIVVRYAELGFQHENDARRFLDAMRARFKEFALTLHPDKTRLIEFGRHAADRRARCGLGKPETFNFLGFTFICGRSRRGNFLLKRKSRRDRVKVRLKEIKEELWRQMHWSIPEQGSWLAQVIRGFFAYHAVPTNFAALGKFRHQVIWLWLRTLRRRSETDDTPWTRMEKLAADFLPKPKILHPWPAVRFAVKHPR